MNPEKSELVLRRIANASDLINAIEKYLLDN